MIQKTSQGSVAFQLLSFKLDIVITKHLEILIQLISISIIYYKSLSYTWYFLLWK